jgi:hypothetical protein
MKGYYYSNFIEQEVGIKRLGNLPEVMPLVRDKAGM